MSDCAFDRLIFLDFDGVLHPAGEQSGYELPFCWVRELTEDLAPRVDVGLVIHSSWIEGYTIADMCEFLEPLGMFVLGMVRPGPKAQAILSHLSSRPGVRSCLVIDDDATQFGVDFPVPVLICDPRKGLSDPETRQRLREWLTHGDRDGNEEGQVVTGTMGDDKTFPTLWTAWGDCFATGEGRSVMACIAFARDEADMRQKFATRFGNWYEKGCEVARGVVHNEVTEFLWSNAALEYMEQAAEHRGAVDAHSKIHVNLS